MLTAGAVVAAYYSIADNATVVMSCTHRWRTSLFDIQSKKEQSSWSMPVCFYSRSPSLSIKLSLSLSLFICLHLLIFLCLTVIRSLTLSVDDDRLLGGFLRSCCGYLACADQVAVTLANLNYSRSVQVAGARHRPRLY